ncbi:cryptochrome/photolyase family protein [Cellulomonas oligotrophica]|uniref:Deoxyribodipyrimidine photo-lyase n=1 Tax=Cellulomonas oligotrophica TaxID=931536 RepID=A0A7Y9FI88_9CELL|nr:cryptochrome/photolyase family protein [Cellulomonas oligotrophica]NYD87836.1 deoxyribodipyrimidine photolyase-related protein [Cellulomonas oligotrophica]GIG32957.1 deoxyribodipyrimidine photo-lyase [Cellulomonas oligotrophica]
MTSTPHGLRRRWLFADQLGPHFLDHPDQPVLLVESRAAFRRRRYHRQKAHLVLSALRHRAAELGDQAVVVRADTYGEALAQVDEPLDVCAPTSRGALRLVESRPGLEVLPHRGFVTARDDFERWAGAQRGGLRLEHFYRTARRVHGVLMDGDAPAGGRWNFDHENREPPPRTPRLDVPGPWLPQEDDIDAEVRADLDHWEADGDVTFVGRDGPRRFAVTRAEAVAALDRFVEHRLPTFGRYEDAMLAADPWMSHSMLSAPMNLGLIDPREAIDRAEHAYRTGHAPIASVEGYVRQLLGWRDYVWHVYWHTGPDYRESNALDARTPLPTWFTDLDADAVEARCLRETLAQVRDTGWVHHIPRLMVLGNWALQRGYDPAALTDWFHESFVDGYAWVMAANVIGMSQHADGGFMATKPYASGGAYIKRMSDYCGGCRYRPDVRVGDNACPFTAGYWWFLHRNRDTLSPNHRMAQPLAGLTRLRDRDALVDQEHRRGQEPP